ncbi:25-hydroxycholesterol 7-alpha-hydroxylase-like [Lecanosticta acicola]|uniref:25-hydroxycholesterol 7-alpha-hydroxylase-like n=1 Tax=Lecanosticta acicola TaxID=111012 RepID=A0AAI8YYX7_9PEZI|nr:25-hydroxycholesterol 7-alpha-hydroxylase-like [Lecanosticta acicola]
MDFYPSAGMARLALYAVSPFILLAIGLLVTRLVTTLNYYRALQQFKDSGPGGQRIVTPPAIPYTIPWLGHTLPFLTSNPGKFWDALFRWYPRSTGVCTLLVGGRKTHVVISTAAVQAMFKAKSPSRDVFEHDMWRLVFRLPEHQAHNAESTKDTEHDINAQYMTSIDRVNELTAQFTRVLEDVLRKDAAEITKLDHIGLYEWLRDRMFIASCTALFGEKIIQMYPQFCNDFYEFDVDFLKFFFRLPTFMMKEGYARQERMYANLARWNAEMHRLSGGSPVDPEGPAYEPLFGSRLNRARQIGYKLRGLDARSSAALDVGITFALSSNVVPITGWMLYHIIDPKAPETLLPRVLAEIKDACKADGSLDIATLVSQPCLQSIWTETLRMYTDVLITRNLPEDITLPLDEDGKRLVQLRKGDNLFAPSWLSHHDPTAWSDESSPPDVFDADRFLSKDAKTGKDTFSMRRSTAKFRPFGGGKTICPGRIFAKQEGIGAVAMVLLKFDLDVKGFVDINKKPTGDFPGLKPALPGTAGLVPGGDMLVKVRLRQQ